MPARIFRAPGRVNLIGEHTDYNDGFVLPAAIRFNTLVAVAQRPDRTLAVYSQNYSEQREFNLDQMPWAPQRHWSDYVVGVAAMLQRTGTKLTGADLLIDGDVPLGSGLSSSASLETAVALALLASPARRSTAHSSHYFANAQSVSLLVSMSGSWISSCRPTPRPVLPFCWIADRLNTSSHRCPRKSVWLSATLWCTTNLPEARTTSGGRSARQACANSHGIFPMCARFEM